MAEATYIEILVFNGDLVNEVTSIKSKTIKALRSELDIDSSERITVNGRNVADGFRLADGMAVSWGLLKKIGGR